MIQKNAYPQPDFARAEWLNLNGAWDFSFDAPTYDKIIEVPYPWGSPLSGIDESKAGTGYYRRNVAWNPAGERIFLIIGAVDYTCEAAVNGTVVGTHRGGYSRFEFDITELWKRDSVNEITVSATDTGANNQTYGKQGYGDARGIWQTVWLETRPAAYIRSFFVQTKIDGTVTYDVDLAGDADGKILAADLAGIHSEVRVENGHAQIKMNVENPELWTPENPHLYEGTLTLGDDVVSTYFGIREIGTGVFGEHQNRYITLNGKPYYINGVLDQSFNPKGFFTLPSDDDCKEEILRLKRIGINMARIHIKAEEPLKLYWADKLGLLIMEDIPCFWGEPLPDTKAQFEVEMREQILRDRNHPSIFYWVIFNETWGLWNHETDADGNKKRSYTQETADWVVDCWKAAKALDPTRLVEDNSPCNRDHTLTDVNTWHFYSNGYQKVKNVVETFCSNAYVGSQANYKEGYTMQDVPCMNSECGNVWGIQGNAGDSDISWQYKYMMNEFRLHDKLCGFVFTEFHDVVNEFNGYYKIDNGDKDFGYDVYQMTLRDLHSQDYLGADFAPMTTVKPGEEVTVPLFGSSFTDVYHGWDLEVRWWLTVEDPVYGDTAIAQEGALTVPWKGYGCFPAGEIKFRAPIFGRKAILKWNLIGEEEVIMANGILFDIEQEAHGWYLTIEPSALTAFGWKHSFDAIQGNKKNGLGSGEFSVTVNTADIYDLDCANDLRILCEASTREPMTHDWPEQRAPEKADLSYMLGYRCDPGANRNSFPQTDERTNPGTMELLIDGVSCGKALLPDCPADSRGALSHYYQAADDLLDEAGSYGYLCEFAVPSRVVLKLREKESFTLTLRTDSDAGLSVYGTKSGRYGCGIKLIAK
ncbi:MAG: glycoside hydrolase family 2 [Clostridia bacterium]|nr:glycoside hydrolase family 2 [Clostridia bacterium]